MENQFPLHKSFKYTEPTQRNELEHKYKEGYYESSTKNTIDKVQKTEEHHKNPSEENYKELVTDSDKANKGNHEMMLKLKIKRLKKKLEVLKKENEALKNENLSLSILYFTNYSSDFFNIDKKDAEMCKSELLVQLH